MHAMTTSHSSDDEDLPSRILVLYASETGNAQDIAERTGREIRRKGGRCLVQSMVEFDIVRTIFASVARVAMSYGRSSDSDVISKSFPIPRCSFSSIPLMGEASLLQTWWRYGQLYYEAVFPRTFLKVSVDALVITRQTR